MGDKAELKIGNRIVENFISYTIESDLYTADDAFSLELANPETVITSGLRCQLRINGRLELDGIIDRCIKSYDKTGVKLRVEGRDLMGLLVDSHCEKFDTIQGMTVKSLAEKLIAPLPFISKSQVIVQSNFIGKGKGKKQTTSIPAINFLETPQRISMIEPGMTVFEVLRGYAASRGYMFWLEYDQARALFVIGRPLLGGAPVYNLVIRKSGEGNNALEGEHVDDISKRYSRIKVITQQQGHETDGIMGFANKINPPPAVIPDKSFPFLKPMVVRMTNDSQSPALHGRLLLEKQRHDGFQLHYRVPGHSQAGINWGINRICQVNDEVLNINGTYLIFGRTFERTKQGTFTRLKLGMKGLVA